MVGWHPKGEEGVGGKICYRHSTEGKGGDSCQGEEKPHSGGWFSVNSLLARCSSLFHLRVEEKLVLNKTWVGGMGRKTVSVLLWDWQKHRCTAVEGAGKCKHIWKGAWSKEGKYIEARRTIHRKPPPWVAALLRVEDEIQRSDSQEMGGDHQCHWKGYSEGYFYSLSLGSFLCPYDMS